MGDNQITREQLARDNELLLREVHHRVKNNFQVIISLIELLVKQYPENESIFVDLSNRIKSMSLTYENLLIERNMGYIDFYEYIKALIKNIKSTCRENISFQIDLDLDGQLVLNLEQATPLGISLNELITNACKHAFKDKRFKNVDKRVEVIVRIDEETDTVEIHVNDNGKGIDKKFIEENQNTLGLNLVNMLIKDQLEGHIYIKKDGGTNILITFQKDVEDA